MTPEALELEELRRRDDDLRTTLATPQGRRLVWRLIDGAGTVRPSFSSDALATAYNEGRRAVGIGLMLESQRVWPEGFLKMFSEQVADAQVLAGLREKAEAEAEEVAE